MNNNSNALGGLGGTLLQITPTSSLLDSAMRHAAKYLDGQEDEDHLLAAAWNLLWAIEMRCKKPECVDTPWREEKG